MKWNFQVLTIATLNWVGPSAAPPTPRPSTRPRWNAHIISLRVLLSRSYEHDYYEINIILFVQEIPNIFSLAQKLPISRLPLKFTPCVSSLEHFLSESLSVLA